MSTASEDVYILLEGQAAETGGASFLPWFEDAVGFIGFIEEDRNIASVAIAGIVEGRDYGAGYAVNIHSARGALFDAIDIEHPSCLCDASICDITQANIEGYSIWAARLLSGATETPLLDAVYDALWRNGEAPTEEETSADGDAFWQAMEGFRICCPSCNTFNFHDGSYIPATCGNCLEPLPEEEGEEDSE